MTTDVTRRGGPGQGGSHVWKGAEAVACGWVLYIEVQCIMGNGHMGTRSGQNDRQADMKILPSSNFIGGR